MRPIAVLTDKLSDVRHMIHVASSLPFDQAYYNCKDKSEIDEIIKRCDRAAFDEWLKNNCDIEHLSIRELRIMAQSKQIPYYSRMDKAQLIKEIKNANACKDRSIVGGHASDNGAVQDK